MIPDFGRTCCLDPNGLSDMITEGTSVCWNATQRLMPHEWTLRLRRFADF